MSESSPLEAQIRDLYSRTVWTHKTYEKCQDILTCRNRLLVVTEIVLSSVVTTGVLGVVFTQNGTIAITTAILSFFTVLTKTLAKSFSLGESASEYALAANKVLGLREQYLSLLTDLRSGFLDNSAVVERRDIIQKDLIEVYSGLPKTFKKAYSRASGALKSNEELTFTDEEIDLLLPIPLRKNKT